MSQLPRPTDREVVVVSAQDGPVEAASPVAEKSDAQPAETPANDTCDLNDIPAYSPWPAATDATAEATPEPAEADAAADSDWSKWPREEAETKPAETSTAENPAESAVDESPAPEKLEVPGDDAGEHSTLPWAKADNTAGQMQAVTVRADDRVRRGFRLAERGALFSARREFLAAMHLVAQANDVQNSTKFFSTALGAGLTALKEASEFSRQTSLGTPVDVSRIVAGHRTPILKGTEVSSPLIAAQRYYNYAQEQLAAAAAKDPAGSLALYGLGRTVLGLSHNQVRSLDSTAQAMALYQAALMADARNFRAANELGVLMTASGQLQQARDLFRHSAAASPQATTWHNLASVHLRLGEHDLAMQAKAQAEILAKAGRTGADPLVHCVDPETFKRTKPASDSVPPPAVASSQPAGNPVRGVSTPNERPAATTASRSLSDWLPWSQRR